MRGKFQGKSLVAVYVNEFDEEFKEILKSRGFKNIEKHNEYMSIFKISEPFPEITLPEGFKLQSLEDENDLNKKIKFYGEDLIMKVNRMVTFQEES